MLICEYETIAPAENHTMPQEFKDIKDLKD